MHLGYYRVPSNWAEGLWPHNLTGSLDALHLETLPEVAASLELRLLAPHHAHRLPLPPASPARPSEVSSSAQPTRPIVTDPRRR